MSDHDEHGPWRYDPLNRYLAAFAIGCAGTIVGTLAVIGAATVFGWLP